MINVFALGSVELQNYIIDARLPLWKNTIMGGKKYLDYTSNTITITVLSNAG